jgi:hypothetical protein
MASSSSARYAKHRRIGEDEEAEEDEEEAEEEVHTLPLPSRACYQSVSDFFTNSVWFGAVVA